MNARYSKPPVRTLVWSAVTAFAMVPVLAARHFVNSDGLAHLYSSWVMLRIIEGDPIFTRLFAINSTPVPNATGHLMLTAMLGLVSPEATQKVMMIIVFAGFTGAVALFHYMCTEERSPVLIALYSTAVGLNGFWLVGMYNFILGMSLGLVTVGLFYRWRDNLSPLRVLAITMLVVATYFSHVLCAAILLASIGCVGLGSANRKRALTVAVLGGLVCLPFFGWYYWLVAREGASVAPEWTFGAASGLVQWLPPNIFAMMNPRDLPFTNESSRWFILLSPMLYIGLAILILFRPRFARLDASQRFLLLLFCLIAVLAVLSPDNFGARNGTLIRERMVLYACAMAPLFFSFAGTRAKLWAAGSCLCFVLVLQFGVLMEYGNRSSRIAAEFIEAVSGLPSGTGVATIGMLDESRRFYVEPQPHLLSYAAAGRELIVWDNYEWGYYMFPTRTAEKEDREFSAKLTRANLFYSWAPGEVLASKRAELASVLADPRLDVVCVYGNDPDVDSIIANNFDPTPFYSGPDVRAFRRRRP